MACYNDKAFWVWRRLVARYLGVVEAVGLARYLGVVEAVGSNPATQTKKPGSIEPGFFLPLDKLKESCLWYVGTASAPKIQTVTPLVWHMEIFIYKIAALG